MFTKGVSIEIWKAVCRFNEIIEEGKITSTASIICVLAYVFQAGEIPSDDFFQSSWTQYTYGDSSCPGLRSRFQILNISGLIMPATFRGMPSGTCGRMQRWRKFWHICMGTKTFHYLRSGSAISHHISSNHDSPAVGIANCSLNWDPFGNSSWTLGFTTGPGNFRLWFFLKNSHCDHNRRQCRKHPSKWHKFPYEIYS